jgi:ABC-type multidrug transport system fused ATPase/permease subunit
MKRQLDTEVVEYGENLSVGQCQLICIARALLRRPKIILMDEATSSLDSVTDSLIQQTVAQTFQQATVITM